MASFSIHILFNYFDKLIKIHFTIFYLIQAALRIVGVVPSVFFSFLLSYWFNFWFRCTNYVFRFAFFHVTKTIKTVMAVTISKGVAYISFLVISPMVTQPYHILHISLNRKSSSFYFLLHQNQSS